MTEQLSQGSSNLGLPTIVHGLPREIPEPIDPEATYYGLCKNGGRIHRGRGREGDVIQPEGRGWRIVSWCGNFMSTFEIDRPPRGKVDEYCKTCWRSIAWDEFVRSMKAHHRQRKEIDG